MKGMFIMCGGCGRTEHISLEGSSEEIMERLDDIVLNKGWRYSPSWEQYICEGCQKDGTEYQTLLGKPRVSRRATSLKQLVYDAHDQLRWF